MGQEFNLGTTKFFGRREQKENNKLYSYCPEPTADTPLLKYPRTQESHLTQSALTKFQENSGPTKSAPAEVDHASLCPAPWCLACIGKSQNIFFTARQKVGIWCTSSKLTCPFPEVDWVINSSATQPLQLPPRVTQAASWPHVTAGAQWKKHASNVEAR